MVLSISAMAQELGASEKTEFNGITVGGTVSDMKASLTKAGYKYQKSKDIFVGKDCDYDVEVKIIADDSGNVSNILAAQTEKLKAQDAIARYNELEQLMLENECSRDIEAGSYAIDASESIADSLEANPEKYSANFFQMPSWAQNKSEEQIQAVTLKMLKEYLKNLCNEEDWKELENLDLNNTENLKPELQFAVSLGAIGFMAEYVFAKRLKMFLVKDGNAFRIAIAYGFANYNAANFDL